MATPFGIASAPPAGGLAMTYAATALQTRIAAHVHEELDDVVIRAGDAVQGPAVGRNVQRAHERALSWLTFKLINAPVSSAAEVRRAVLRGLIELAPPLNPVERRRATSGHARAKVKIRKWALEAATMLDELCDDGEADSGAWLRRESYTGPSGRAAVGLKVHLE